jgi:hypothetical protein
MGKHIKHSEKYKRFKEIVKKICGKNWKKINGVMKYYVLKPYYRDVK